MGRQFLLFGAIGAVGFLVDAGAYLLAYALGAGLYGRFFSFLCAATFTWVLNRAFNFKDRSGSMAGQWAKFLLANSAGAIVNLAVFFLAMNFVPPLRDNPQNGSIVAIALGSLAGLVFNFTASKVFVFKSEPDK